MNYHVESPGRIYDCGEASVVYFDLQTGDTHLVSEFAAHLIRLLTSQTMDINALTARVLPDFDADHAQKLEAAIPDIIEELVGLAIVERV